MAANHFVLVRCCDLLPWLGGGFGMFSTVDARRLVAWRSDDAGVLPLEIPADLEDAAARCEALPSSARLGELARRLGEAPAQRGAGVRVEVWETRFGPGMRPEPRLLRAVAFDARDERR